MCGTATPEPVGWRREQCAALPYGIFEAADFSWVFPSLLPDGLIRSCDQTLRNVI